MKLTILFAALASYTVAFFRHLAEEHGWQIQLIYQPTKADAPYKPFDLSFCQQAVEDLASSRSAWERAVIDFRPDCVLMSSWGYPHFMSLTRRLRRLGTFVVATMDNQWHGTPKQMLGVLSSRVFLKPSIDTFLVAGDRQAQFAARLGYSDVMYGYLACDASLFRRPDDKPLKPGRFLYVGRLSEEKGIRELLAAYRMYRAAATAPWELAVAGTGPLATMLVDHPQVQSLGFVQPGDLPELMWKSSALILPSLFEPWGVVIHEAAVAGLPIICTPACGAMTYFVRDGVNGFIVPGNASSLAMGMRRLATLTPSSFQTMGRVSQQLGMLWTPPMLASYFTDQVRWRLTARARGGHL